MDLNLIAPMNQLGYGQVGQNILHALSRFTQYDVALFPIGQVRMEDVKSRFETIQNSINLAKTPNFNAPCIRLWHQHDMSQFVGNGKKIGFPIFELDTFTKQEKHHLCNLDHIFVCSGWAKSIILKELDNSSYMVGDNKVSVIPLGVQTYDIESKPTSGPTKFFTCGKWEIRKGHDAVIEAFNLAFKDHDDVELHMMCTNPFLNAKQHKAWENKYLGSELGHKVRFLPRVDSHQEVLKTMNSMDCGVFISRAEGWNLELLEMMSLGKPVIATNYSGHTEFCNSDNSLLVEIDELETAVDNIWFHGQGRWAKLGAEQVTQTARHMRDVHVKKPTNIEGINTGKKFTWKNTTTEIMDAIDSFRDF